CLSKPLHPQGETSPPHPAKQAEVNPHRPAGMKPRPHHTESQQVEDVEMDRLYALVLGRLLETEQSLQIRVLEPQCTLPVGSSAKRGGSGRRWQQALIN